MGRFIIGINYWPRQSAMYMWQRFDIAHIGADMEQIAQLNMQVVRFFLEWEAFQPQPETIDGDALRNLRAVMDAISDAGLQAMPTLFCGHMSGVNWLPAWSLDENTPAGRFRTITHAGDSPFGVGDIYADERLLRAQELFCREVSAAIGSHPAMYAWDLGNEFSNIREPRASGDGAAWSARLSAALREHSRAPVTGGNHGEDVERDRHIRLSSMSQPWEFQTMHGYSVYPLFSRGRLDTDVVPFYLRIAQACSHKDVLFSEFGNPTCPPGMVSPYDREPLPGDPPVDPRELPANAAPYACLTEDEMARYADEVIGKLHANGATGALWWCWADYADTLFHLPPFDRAVHERFFGIVRSDGALKPVATVLSKWGKAAREVVAAPPPLFTSETAFYESLPEGIYTAYHEYCRHH